MATKGNYKEGGSGKGQAIRLGLDLDKYGENLDKTHGTRVEKCLDCKFFKGINCINIVNCIVKNHKGLNICKLFEVK